MLWAEPLRETLLVLLAEERLAELRVRSRAISFRVLLHQTLTSMTGICYG